MTPSEAVQAIQDACDALSHASYCAITGMKVTEQAIEPAYTKLRELLECVAPKDRFDAEPPKPTLCITKEML